MPVGGAGPSCSAEILKYNVGLGAFFSRWHEGRDGVLEMQMGLFTGGASSECFAIVHSKYVD